MSRKCRTATGYGGPSSYVKAAGSANNNRRTRKNPPLAAAPKSTPDREFTSTNLQPTSGFSSRSPLVHPPSNPDFRALEPAFPPRVCSPSVGPVARLIESHPFSSSGRARAGRGLEQPTVSAPGSGAPVRRTFHRCGEVGGQPGRCCVPTPTAQPAARPPGRRMRGPGGPLPRGRGDTWYTFHNMTSG